MLCFPLNGYEWEAFCHKRLNCGFGLMFLVSSQDSRIVWATGHALMPRIIPFGMSAAHPPLQKCCELSGNPCLKFPGDVETSHARSLRVARASAEQGYLRR